MAVPGHICEGETILSLSAIPVLSQADTAVMPGSTGLGSQEDPALCVAPQLREELAPFRLASTFHSHVILGTALPLPKAQFPHL